VVLHDLVTHGHSAHLVQYTSSTRSLFDVVLQTLAYNAGMYGRAQALRREGTAPAAMGIADNLPTRFAYEQLHALSGMASKVCIHVYQGFQGSAWNLLCHSQSSCELFGTATAWSQGLVLHTTCNATPGGNV
jgi:hypothetical protein